MPWDFLLGSATGAGIILVLALLFGKALAEQVAASAGRGFESALLREEERYRQRLELTSAIDTDLRDKRVAVYKTLWKHTGTLPKWPQNRDLTYGDLCSLCEALRDWYFEEGGIYLSTSARTAYGDVQRALAAAFEEDAETRVPGPHYESIRQLCSRLRTELTGDLLSRRAAPLADGTG